MNNDSDDDMRRLFATGDSVGPDEAFVARISTQVASRRRWSRIRTVLVTTALAATGFTLAVGLAPLAPSVPGAKGALSLSLLRLPEQMTGLVLSGIHQLPASPWLYMIVAACVLPLAGTAWLVRR